MVSIVLHNYKTVLSVSLFCSTVMYCLSMYISVIDFIHVIKLCVTADTDAARFVTAHFIGLSGY